VRAATDCDSDSGSNGRGEAAAVAEAAAAGARAGPETAGAFAVGGEPLDPLEAGAARWLHERCRRGGMVRECSIDGMYQGIVKERGAGRGRLIGSSSSSSPVLRSLENGTAGGAAGALIVADGRAAAKVREAGGGGGLPRSGLPWGVMVPSARRASSCSARSSGGSEGAGQTRWLLFEVEDTGCGIGPEGLHGLFKEYVQGTEDEMRKPRSKGGTGLGLSICSKQVAVVGGAIGAHSCLGAGSTFWFMIPAIVLPGPGDAQQAAAAAEAGSPVGGSSSGGVLPGSALLTPDRWLRTTAPAAAAATPAFGTCSVHTRGGHSGGVLCSCRRHSSGGGSSGGIGSSGGSDCHGATHLPESAARGGVSVAGAASSSSDNNSSSVGAGAGSEPGGISAPPGRPSTGSHLSCSGAIMCNDPSHLSSSRTSHGSGSDENRSRGGGGAPGCIPAGPTTSAPGALQVRVAPFAAANAAPAAPPLPQPPLPQPPLPQPQPAYAVSTPAAPPGLGGTGKPVKAPLDAPRLVGLAVLLAEDNAINQLVAKKMLAGLGMRVVIAANGQEAVDAVEAAAAAHHNPGDISRSGGPDGFAVVLMDLLMPVMDGLEATRAIRAAGHAIPIVAMTANAGDKDRAECAAAGMDGFLPKPVLKDQLAGAILAVLPPEDPSSRNGGGGAPAAVGAGAPRHDAMPARPPAAGGPAQPWRLPAAQTVPATLRHA
jgi:CheY-like chemotaxis protein